MKVSEQERRLHDAQAGHKLGFLVAALGVFTIAAAICNEATPTTATPESIWPTQEWRTSSPEEEGMDSKELAKLVDWGTSHNFDSLLVQRHGKIVAEAYYAPYYARYAAGNLHAQYSVTKSVIGTLTGIACKEGLLDSPSHRVLDFLDQPNIANVDQRKEAITVQNLLDMTSGIEWTEQVGSIIPATATDGQMGNSLDWVKFVLDRPMPSPPGDIFNYNSGNPHLLSAILTKLTGMSALEYAKAKLFSPLGISDVSWSFDAQGISTGGWGLYLQPRDMAKIGNLYLHNGMWEGKQLLPPEWVNKVSQPTADTHLRGFLQGFWYSNFFWVLPDKHVYMALGRRGQVIMVFRDLDVVAVATGHKGYPPREFADAVSGSVKSDTTIPADAAGEKELANKILDVSTDKAR
jgi:CubicO group peptidase (beta-lactamase class C family)